MNFLSVQFFVFFVLLYIIVQSLKKAETRNCVILAASAIFYAFWDLKFLILLFADMALTYYVGLQVDKQNSESEKKRKIWVKIGCGMLLLILAVFKYYNFFIHSFCAAFNIAEAGILKIALPIGISFYTFQSISYVVDVYRGEIESRKDFVKVALYIGFFPYLLSGPIVRAVNFLPQLDRKNVVSKPELWDAIWIFTSGVVKKFIIADRLSVCVDAVFAAPGAYSAPSLICAVVAYSVQLYCDFAGYSDMAIGIAKALGFDLGRNFDLPYMSQNPTEFWRRWHISLSTWLKKYLYISLGGNRKGKLRTDINLFLTMLLGGLWHGANWTFVVWGALHGVALIIHKHFMRAVKHNAKAASDKQGFIKQVFCIFINFVFVTICWVFFRAESVSSALMILKRIFIWADGVDYIYVYTLIYVPVVFAVNIFAYVKNNKTGFYLKRDMDRFSSKLLFCCVIWTIVLLAYFSSNPFIYVQF